MLNMNFQFFNFRGVKLYWQWNIDFRSVKLYWDRNIDWDGNIDFRGGKVY